MVGWTTNDGTADQAHVRIYDQQANPQSGVIPITVKRSQTLVRAIDTNANGQLAVLYKKVSHRGNTSLSVQRFDAAGQMLGNATTPAAPNLAAPPADIALADNGTYIVSWVDSGGKIFAQRVDANNSLTGDTIVVHDSAQLHAWNTRIGVDNSGGFVVAFTTTDSDSNFKAHLKYYDANGSQQGTEVNIPIALRSSDMPFGFEVNGSSEIGISWDEQDDVMSQRFRFDDSAGQIVALDASPYRVNSTISELQRDTNLALGPNGSMSVVWNGNGRGDDEGVFVQRFVVAGNQAPSAVNDAATTNKDEVTTISVLSNDSDPDGD